MQPKMTMSRAFIYAALLLFALYFLFPLYVMLSTSFKDLDQLRTGNLQGTRCVVTEYAVGVARSNRPVGECGEAGLVHVVSVGRQHVLKAFLLAHDLLGTLRIRPQIWVGSLLFDFG